MAGKIVPGRCATAAELVTLETPWKYDTGPYKGQVIRLTCHRAVKGRLKLAMKNAKRYSNFNVERCDSFNCRPIRGSSTLSNHGYGKAWDIFATHPLLPPPGGVWKPDDHFGPQFAECFTDLGFTWGSQWQRADWPHLEWSGFSVPILTPAERRRVNKAAKKRYDEKRDHRHRTACKLTVARYVPSDEGQECRC